MLSLILVGVSCSGGSIVVGGDTAAPGRDRDTDSWVLDDTGDSGGSEAPREIAIDLVDPSTALTTGGEPIRVLGGPLDPDGDDPLVTIGGAEATVTGWTATSVELLTPPGAEGPATVTLAQGEASASADGLFAYAEPCEGITRVDPTPVTGDANHEERLSVTLWGCATGIVLAERTRDSGELDDVYEVESYPSSVDGQEKITVWHYGSPGLSGTVQWSFHFDTDQGRFTVEMELEGDGR